jgi:hypothetical protein
LAAKWDDFLTEETDRLQGKFWVHARVVEAEPHEGHVELVAVLQDTLGHLLRRTDEDALLLELVEVEVVPFAWLAPARVRLLLRAQRVLHLLLGAAAVLGDVHLAEEWQPSMAPAGGGEP